jgi:tryptophanyl-tRNA synthetase
MKTCYVIVAGEGDYSERSEWPVLVFLDQDKAIDTMKKLESISARAENKKQTSVARRAVAREYKAFGLDADKLSVFTDWKLEEAQFDDSKFGRSK